MATPSVAASCAIIYQYLQEGFYHNSILLFLFMNVETMDIRASLIKAMIIHSGVPTKGICSKDFSCTEFPEEHRKYYEGFGRVQLDQILRVKDSPFELFLYYGQVNDKKQSFSIQVPLTISFRID